MGYEKEVWTWLKQNTEFPDVAIAAIMGNMEAESNIEPMRKQGDFTKDRSLSRAYMNTVDGGNTSTFFSGVYGWGLCQWTYPSRCQGLFNYCKSKGVSVGNLYAQLEWMYRELYTEYKTVYNALMTAANIATPCARFMLEFERPADQSAAAQAQRYSYADAIYQRNHNPVQIVTDKKEEPAKDSSEAVSLLLDAIELIKKAVEML